MKKILLSSDPNARFDLLLPKIQQLHAKNKFDFMLICGKVCPSSATHIFKDIKDKNIYFPLPTYFVDNSDMGFVFSQLYPQGSEIVTNFWYLGNYGVKNIQGINVAFISGLLEDQLKDINGNKDLKYLFTKQSARQLIESTANEQIDILITNQWCPEFTKVTSQLFTGSSAPIISQICSKMSPRYHLAASGQKYFRLPSFEGQKKNPTHFINVAEIKQALPKDKYLVAIQMNPETRQIIQNLANNPFSNSTQEEEAIKQNKVHGQQVKKSSSLFSQIKINKPKQAQQPALLQKSSLIMFHGFPEETPNYQITQFLEKWGEIREIEVFKALKSNKKSGIVRFANLKDAEICLKDSGKYSLYQSRIKFEIKQQNQKYRLQDCFLCMGNSKFDRSLLVKQAKFCFVCLDKGPVSEYHFQIVPLNHVASTADLEAEQQQQISRVRSSFQQYFTNKGYTFISIERNMKLSTEINHSILHLIALKMSEDDVLQKFHSVNQQNRLNFEAINKAKSQSSYYVIIQINKHKFIRYVQAKDKRFQIGRQVICEIIEKPERLNWRDCEVSGETIKKLIQELKKIEI